MNHSYQNKNMLRVCKQFVAQFVDDFCIFLILKVDVHDILGLLGCETFSRKLLKLKNPESFPTSLE